MCHINIEKHWYGSLELSLALLFWIEWDIAIKCGPAFGEKRLCHCNEDSESGPVDRTRQCIDSAAIEKSESVLLLFLPSHWKLPAQLWEDKNIERNMTYFWERITWNFLRVCRWLLMSRRLLINLWRFSEKKEKGEEEERGQNYEILLTCVCIKTGINSNPASRRGARSLM